MAKEDREGVCDDLYKVQAVPVAEMARFAAEAANESEQTKADLTIGEYDPAVITMTGESRDHSPRANRHTNYHEMPCGVAEYVKWGVRVSEVI